jgi:hypothetical protein
MSLFSFIDPATGARFRVEGRTDLTEAQARTIFEQQRTAGGLVGMRAGDTVNSWTQAMSGLDSARAEVAQSVAQAPRPGTAVQTVSRLTQASFSGVPSAGISVADYGRQLPALRSIANLDQSVVRGTVAQAATLSGQTVDQISNLGGVGKFGLSAMQLERQGVIKPGTVARFLGPGSTNTLQSVLKSPAVWTGKQGMSGLSDMLSNGPAQDRMQQDLMKTGLKQIKSFGIPVDSLSAQSVAGLTLTSAKSVEGAVDWAQGRAGGIASGLQSQFDNIARNASFAVGFTNTKVSNAMKGIEIPQPATDTVQRQTVDAAATRVVGNEKVPPVSYNTQKQTVDAAALDSILLEQKEAIDRVKVLNERWGTTLDQEDLIADNPNIAVDIVRELESIASDLTDTKAQFQNIKQRAEAFKPPRTVISERAELFIRLILSTLKSVDQSVVRVRQKAEAARR